MIRAEYKRRGEEQELTLRGHATGSPAVCAAASALVCALAGWLRSARADGLELKLQPGDARIVCRGGAEEEVAFGLVLLGLAQLGRDYPPYLALKADVSPAA